MSEQDTPASTVDHAQLLDAICQGMYVVDARRSITYWNAAATRISGYSPDDTLGRFCGDGLLNHVDPDGGSLCGSRCPLLLTMADGHPRTARVLLHHAGGHMLPVHITASALRDESGRITGAVETFTDDSHTADAERRLAAAQELAMTDALTGLGNRRFLEARLTERIQGAGAVAGSRFSVVMFDLDRFKTINDTHGHVVGDRALATVAETLRRTVRAGDDVVRFGGDEFVVLTGPMSAQELHEFSSRLSAAVGQTRLHVEGGYVRVSASVGAAFDRPGDTPESVTARVDAALRDAKRAGRNRTVLRLPE